MTLDDVLDYCLGEKMGGCLTDFDPLVAVMDLVTEFIGEQRLQENLKARRLWFRAVMHLQEHDELEHNNFIPCRYCSTAFEPVVNDKLLDMFLRWSDSGETKDLLAIHCCSACGGQLDAIRTKIYKGDGFTPPPGSVTDDVKWADALLTGPQIEIDES